MNEVNIQKAESINRDESGQWWISFNDGVKVRLNDSHNWIAERTRQDTLREVFQWFEKRRGSYQPAPNWSTHYILTHEEKDSLERGVLPEGEVK